MWLIWSVLTDIHAKTKNETCVNGGRTVQNKVYFLTDKDQQQTNKTPATNRGKAESTHLGDD